MVYISDRNRVVDNERQWKKRNSKREYPVVEHNKLAFYTHFRVGKWTTVNTVKYTDEMNTTTMAVAQSMDSQIENGSRQRHVDMVERQFQMHFQLSTAHSSTTVPCHFHNVFKFQFHLLADSTQLIFNVHVFIRNDSQIHTDTQQYGSTHSGFDTLELNICPGRWCGVEMEKMYIFLLFQYP